VSTLQPASIIISSYNYRRFLREAIDSALGQTYPNTEVIVVDDGSTDDSREIIAGYGDRIIAVLKENAGQASAWNAGFRASRGELIVFLDSDDVLGPTSAEQAVGLFERGQVAKVHWPLVAVDEQGRATGNVVCPRPSEGDLRERVSRAGPESYRWPPTSGNAWSRTFLEKVLPIPEPEYRVCPDFYLAALAPLFGRIETVSEPQAYIRHHGSNHGWRQPFEERVREQLQRSEHCLGVLAKNCQAMGIETNLDLLRNHSWWHQIQLAIEQITALIPPGESFILVDQGAWGTEEIDGRRCVPFMGRGGRYVGRPSDDTAAIRELERLRDDGVSLIAFVWPNRWWLDHYPRLHAHLRSTSPCITVDEHLVMFDLRSTATAAPTTMS
jgi:hypothetical protein